MEGYTLSISFPRTATATLAAAATTISLFSAVPTAHALDSSSIDNAADCLEVNNVWVYVEYGADTDKNSKGACATEFDTGFEALESAGFVAKYDQFEFGRFLKGIDGVVPVWEETGTYWNNYSGTVAADNTVSYEYAIVGGDDTTPAPGSVEAWVVSDGTVDPALTAIPVAPTGSSESNGIFALIAGVFAVVGGAVAALYSGLISIPGLVLPKI